MKKFNNIAIVGVGLIGGSIGLAIKARRAAGSVTGIFRRKSTLKKALKRGAVDRATLDLKEGVRDADLIILATPVSSIPALARDVIKHAKSGAIITDAGSTKKWIVETIEKSLGRERRPAFVGAHPMAGSEQTSVDYARADLFLDSPCIITRTAKTDARALAKVAGFWKALGARVTVMSPLQHDKSVSLISHLPHLVAFSLAGAVPVGQLAYAAEGFKDTTRIASSDADLWADIFLTNRKETLASIRLFERELKRIAALLSGNDRVRLVRMLCAIRSKRDRLANGKRT